MSHFPARSTRRRPRRAAAGWSALVLAAGAACASACTSADSCSAAAGSASPASGCGGPAGASPLPSVSAPPASYPASSAAKVTDENAVTVKGSAEDAVDDGEEFTSTEKFQPFAADVQAGYDGTAGEITHEVLTGGVLFLQTEPRSTGGGHTAAAAAWTSTRFDAVTAGDAAQLGRVVLENPLIELDALIAAAAPPTYQGAWNMAGQTVYKYYGKLDLTALTRAPGYDGLTQAQRGALATYLNPTDFAADTVTMWVSAATGLPVRASVYALTAAQDAITIVVLYSGWGGPVRIAAPGQ